MEKEKIKRNNRIKYLLKKQKLETITEKESEEVTKFMSEKKFTKGSVKKKQQKYTGDGVMFFQKMNTYLEKKKIKRKNKLGYLLKKQKLGTITEKEIEEINKLMHEKT